MQLGEMVVTKLVVLTSYTPWYPSSSAIILGYFYEKISTMLEEEKTWSKKKKNPTCYPCFISEIILIKKGPLTFWPFCYFSNVVKIASKKCIFPESIMVLSRHYSDKTAYCCTKIWCFKRCARKACMQISLWGASLVDFWLNV